AFMKCVNELTEIKCHKKTILEQLLIALAPFAPFITEELYEKLGHANSIHLAKFPQFNEEYLAEETFSYPVSVNGKLRANIDLPLDISEDEARERILELEAIQKWTDGKPIKKFIFVKGRIANIVV
ncbi:MAG: class I tRNA ligase family protein, partial [Chitinophagales bacterium]|nr:class I tRNA ligase family protein [Chitinophagales bacterium]